MRAAVVGLVGVCVALLGCGGDDGMRAIDGGTGEVDAATGIAPPAAPAPPVLVPCPSGWTVRTDADGLEVCEPPSGEPCAPGLERFVDDAACVPVGDPCGESDWAEAPPGVPAVYVRAGAIAGNGTQAQPYGSVQAAIDAAPPGGAILVGKGTYDEPVDILGGLSVIGACAAETILAPSTTVRFSSFGVRAIEPGSRLANVTIAPVGDVAGIEVRGELDLWGVVVSGAADEAIFVHEGGTLGAEALVVRDSRPITPLHGRGLTVSDGGATVHRAIFERCPGAAVLGSTGGSTALRAIVVRDSGQSIAGAPQIISQGGGVVEVSDSVLEDAEGSGLFANEDGILRVDQVLVRRMRDTDEPNRRSAGALVKARGRLEARRLRIEDVDLLGVVGGQDATMILEDLHVSGVAARLFEGVPVAIGLLYKGPDLIVRRARIADVERVGVQIEETTQFEIEDLECLRAGSVVDSEFTASAVAALQSAGTIRRARIAESHGAGVLAIGSDLILEDASIEDVLPGREGRFGRGIEISGGTATIARLAIERARDVGVHAVASARVELSSARIAEILPRDCAATTCADVPGGHGLASIGAAMSASAFAIEGASLCGTLVARGAGLDLAAGQIRDTAIGTCVQVDGYDLARVTGDVLYLDNGVNVSTTTHAVPEPPNPLSGVGL